MIVASVEKTRERLLDAIGWAEASEKNAFMYMPHGVIVDQFSPANAESFLTSAPPALDFLRPVLDQCLMMKGIPGVPHGPFKGASCTRTIEPDGAYTSSTIGNGETGKLCTVGGPNVSREELECFHGN